MSSQGWYFDSLLSSLAIVIVYQLVVSLSTQCSTITQPHSAVLVVDFAAKRLSWTSKEQETARRRLTGEQKYVGHSRGWEGIVGPHARPQFQILGCCWTGPWYASSNRVDDPSPEGMGRLKRICTLNSVTKSGFGALTGKTRFEASRCPTYPWTRFLRGTGSKPQLSVNEAIKQPYLLVPHYNRWSAMIEFWGQWTHVRCVTRNDQADYYSVCFDGGTGLTVFPSYLHKAFIPAP